MTVRERLQSGRPAPRRRSAIGLAALALLAAACGSERPVAQGGATTTPIRVSVGTVAATDLSDTFEAGGLLAAPMSTDISSRVVAPVRALRVRAGDRVTAGHTLVVLDADTLGAEARRSASSVTAAERALDAVRSDHVSAQAELTLAEAWQRRIAALRGQASATAQELDEADARVATVRARVQGLQSRIAQAEAEVEAARAAAESAQTTASFSTVTAPFDGLVTETFVDVGALAQPGRPLLRLDSLGAADVHVRVDESRAAMVQVGDAVSVSFTGDDSGESSSSTAGTVREVAHAVSTDDRTFVVKVSLATRVSRRAGSFARVRFGGTARQALTVPTTAVRRQGQVTTVFVVDGAVARVRLVRVGQTTGDRAEVLAGLSAGERVVAPVPSPLVDRSPVTVTESAP